MRRTKELFLFFFLLSIVIFPLFYNVKITEFHPDETIWLLESKYFKLLMLDGQPWQRFRNDPNGAYWILSMLCDQPCVGKRIYIAASDLLGHKIQDLDLIRWDFFKDKKYNLLRNTVPPKEILFYYRYVAASFSALSCLLIFLIGARISNNYTGLIAAAGMASHPLMAVCGTRATGSGFLLFFICLSAYLSVLFLSSLSRAGYIRAILISALTAAAASLATATKFSGALAYFLFAALCLFCLFSRLFSKLKEKTLSFADILKDGYTGAIILSVIVFVITAAAVLIIADPYIRNNPVENMRHMMVHRMEVVELQREVFEVGLYNIRDRITYMWKTLFSPQGRFVLLKNRYNIPAYFIFILIGAYLMLKDEIAHLFNNGYCSLRIIVLLWFFITLGVLLLFVLLIDWERYLLPLLPPVSLLLGYSVGEPAYRIAKTMRGLKEKHCLC